MKCNRSICADGSISSRGFLSALHLCCKYNAIKGRYICLPSTINGILSRIKYSFCREIISFNTSTTGIFSFFCILAMCFFSTSIGSNSVFGYRKITFVPFIEAICKRYRVTIKLGKCVNSTFS